MNLPLKAYASCATKCYQNSSVLPTKFRRRRDTNYPEWKDKDFSSLRGKLEAESYGKTSKTDNENAMQCECFPNQNGVLIETLSSL